MTRAELLLGEDAVTAAPDGVDVAVRMPWYRSLPLTSVVDLEVEVDGTVVGGDAIRIRVGEDEFSLAEAAEAPDRVWFIQDPGVVRVPTPPLAAGDTVEVRASIELRFPYIIIEGHGPLTRRTDARRTATVGEARS